MSKESKNIEAIDLVEMMPDYVATKKNNPIMADLKYKGKPVKFSGIITNIHEHKSSKPNAIDINISTAPNYDEAKMGGIKDVCCFLSNDQMINTANLKQYDTISACGVFVEYSSKDCPSIREPEAHPFGMYLSTGRLFDYEKDKTDERIIINDVAIVPTSEDNIILPTSNESTEAPSIVETFIDLYKLDNENKAAAKLKYDGMIVRATGEVCDIVKRKDNSCMVEIDIQSMPGYDSWAIYEAFFACCYFNSEELGNVAKLSLHKTATVEGAISYRDIRFMQSIYRVSIDDCKVIDCKA